MVSWDTLCECDVEALEKTRDSFSQDKTYAIHKNIHSLISETTEILHTNLLWFFISMGSSLVGLPFQSHFSFCLSLYNVISYMNFFIHSSETYYCSFSSESCPPVKIFQPRHCQWCIRTETRWSCRGHLSVDPIIAGFYVLAYLTKWACSGSQSQRWCSSLKVSADVSQGQTLVSQPSPISQQFATILRALVYTKEHMLEFWPESYFTKYRWNRGGCFWAGWLCKRRVSSPSR